MKSIIVLAALSLVALSAAHGASFDCAKAKSFAERQICANEKVSTLDSKLAEVYSKRLAVEGDAIELKTRQRTWIKQVRDKCRDLACLEEVYSRRIEDIEGEPRGCEGSTAEQVRCYGDQLERAEAKVDALCKTTLLELDSFDPDDTRRLKTLLERAQKQWSEYRKDQCAFIGAIQGGSSLSETRFAILCELEEVRQRKNFFEHVPWGDH
jgi:uncharacterized protein